MILVQTLIKKGVVKTRVPVVVAGAAAGTEAPSTFSAEDRKRVMVVLMMLCFSMTFWFVFQQAGSSLTLFAREYTDRVLGGFEIPASWFQTINAFLIVALGPVFALLWKKRTGKFPASPIKFALGIMFAAFGFFWLVPHAYSARPTLDPTVGINHVNMGWLVGVYVFHTIGELCVSPVGMAYVSKLAPKQLSGQLMGAWFFATGIGSYMAGKTAGLMNAYPVWQIFLFCGLIALGMSLLLWFVVSRVIHKIMGGYS